MSTQRQQRVFDLYQAGKTIGEIASDPDVDVTTSTVIRDLAKLGIHSEHAASKFGREYRAELAPSVRELVEAGVTSAQVCERLRMSYDTLRTLAAEHGITLVKASPGRPSRKAALFPRARQMWDDGSSQSEISVELDVPLGTLSRWFSDEGVEVHRIDRSDQSGRHLNFGSTPEERSQTARDGGVASGEALGPLPTKTCEHCGETFTHARDEQRSRKRFCSREHAYAHRRQNSGKTTTYTCRGCTKEFQGWTNTPREYCSRKCFYGRTPTQIGVDGVLLDSWWEAALMGVARLLDVPCSRVDRSTLVESDAGYYAPDVLFPTLGVHVEVKGQVDPDDTIRWAAWRAQRGPLVVLGRDELDELRRAHSDAIFLAILQELRYAQNAEAATS